MDVAKLNLMPAAFAIQLGQVYQSVASHLLTTEHNALLLKFNNWGSFLTPNNYFSLDSILV